MDRGFVSHAVPGRLRVRIPARRGDEAYFSRVAATLRQCGEVTSVHPNPFAASILVAHRLGSLSGISAYARAHGLFVLQSDQPMPARSLPEVAAAQWAEANRLLGSISGGQLQVQSLFFQLFAGLALGRLGGLVPLQSAVSLLWGMVELMRAVDSSPASSEFGLFRDWRGGQGRRRSSP